LIFVFKRLVHKKHTLVHKRQAEPLTAEEKARFSEYYHSPYYEMKKYEIPTDDDVNHIINLQNKSQQKGLKNPIMST
jgi:hypothetical protein